MTTQQFEEWRAYADLEPFDETRADLRAASIVQAIFNVNRGKGPALKIKECLLRWEEEAAAAKPRTPEQAREQVRRTMELLMAIHNRPSKPVKAKKTPARKATARKGRQ